ncbi:MAG: response regulator transcription factor [Elusimicrobia bacterium]|nr:response regulator transcription factor [Elusimicrobiota bacterium]
MPQRILVADDVESLRKAVDRALKLDGFETLLAADGSDALLMASESRPDLVLADAVMPGLTGHELCRILKKKDETRGIPVIIMSGEMIEEKDVVTGLEGGADDYIVKPFPMKVLLARIKAVLRRYDHGDESRGAQKRSGITLNPEARTVKVSGTAVELARKEFDLLALLLAHPGRVLKPGFLLETVWGYDLADYNDPHTVETHVSRLRKKLGPAVSKHIVSVRGIGYRFDA